MDAPKIGTTFLHAKWLESDYRTPLTCIVTAIRSGCIYYKSPGAKKAFEYCALDRWSSICKQIVSK